MVLLVHSLFVYGTLRRAAAHPMHARLRAGAHPLGPGRVRGVLVRVGSYPGLVLDPAAGWVQGELYALWDPAVLEPLDAYEGAGPLDPEPREYRRVRARVERTDEPSALEAWIYEYARPIAGLPVIASGDFLRPER